MKKRTKSKDTSQSKCKENDVKLKMKKQLQQQAKRKQKRISAVTLRDNISLYAMVLTLIGFIAWAIMTPPVAVKKKSIKSSSEKTGSDKNMNTAQYTVLDILPHDSTAFTQGLSYYDKKLYESTGLHGESQIRVLNPMNGTEIFRNISLDDKLFGEGLTYFTDSEGNPRLLLLTWKSQLGYIYDLDLNLVREFKFETNSKEGWGVTYNMMDEEFVVSDGTSILYMWDRDTLEETRRLNVTIKYPDANGTIISQPLNYLNELEFWNEYVLANVWYRDYIVAINPESGSVVNSFDFSTLYTTEDKRGEHDVLNGITVVNTEEKEDELIVTGKNWPNMFRVQLH